MRLLLDENLSFKLCERISDVFPDTAHVSLLGLARADDRAIWEYAKTNGLTLVTLDADFSEMAALIKPPPKVIWLRCGNLPTDSIEALLRERASAIRAFDADDAVCLEVY